jgi:hypothetical protein
MDGTTTQLAPSCMPYHKRDTAALSALTLDEGSSVGNNYPVFLGLVYS